MTDLPFHDPAFLAFLFIVSGAGVLTILAYIANFVRDVIDEMRNP
jgi:hypothetical protein